MKDHELRVQAEVGQRLREIIGHAPEGSVLHAHAGEIDIEPHVMVDFDDAEELIAPSTLDAIAERLPARQRDALLADEAEKAKRHAQRQQLSSQLQLNRHRQHANVDFTPDAELTELARGGECGLSQRGSR